MQKICQYPTLIPMSPLMMSPLPIIKIATLTYRISLCSKFLGIPHYMYAIHMAESEFFI